MKTIKSEVAAPMDFDRWMRNQKPAAPVQPVDPGPICDRVKTILDRSYQNLQPFVDPASSFHEMVEELRNKLDARDPQGFVDALDYWGGKNPDGYDLLTESLFEEAGEDKGVLIGDWREFDQYTGLDKVTK